MIPVIFGGDYWTRTSGLMRVNIQWCCFLWNFSGSIPVYHRISSLGYTLSSIASAPFFLLVGQEMGQCNDLLQRRNRVEFTAAARHDLATIFGDYNVFFQAEHTLIRNKGRFDSDNLPRL